MPLKINVGLARKLGLPSYSSVGASCAVEFEAELYLLQEDLERFHQRVQSAFAACSQAIEDELARQQGNAQVGRRPQGPTASLPTVSADTNGETPAGNGHSEGAAGSNPNGQTASEKQMGYLRQLAAQIRGLGVRRLESVAQRICGKPLAALSSKEASVMIDTLQDVRAGKLDLANVLEEAPA